MAIFKCKMCGGTIEFEQGASVGVCDSCGTKQTLPRLDNDKKSALYDRANHFRRNNEFDKAMGIYEQILNEDNTDAEAYWSLVLCKYGIDYVEDPTSHKRIPTVNRTQYTAVFDDENYKAALQYADGYQREIYEEEAKAINEIQKGILSISQQEEPFDVFICYKETDASGRRTPDSVLANDLYYGLTQEGFKVFFARITLEDKLGTAYEPYIFAALNSAKVMVVLGTKPEYFNAVWVKNEWSRYLALVKQSGGKKMLIPAYKDMDPYDLPEEFAHLQSQDMGKLGFMQDLIRGIKKIAAPEETKTVIKEVAQGSSIDKAALLKRASLFLLDGNWKSANEYCDKVLDTDPENAEAYLYKLMADLQVKKESDIADCVGTLVKNNNYGKIMLFGSDELKAKLREYDNSCKYNYAISVLHDHQYVSARKLFEELHGYKDSESKIEECGRGIEQQWKEQQRQRKDAEEAARKAEEERKIKERKKVEKVLVTKLIISFGILFLLFFPFLMSELCIENDGFGAVVFVMSIILSIPCGIAYLVTTVKKIMLKKKTTYIEVFHGEKAEKITKINTTLLASFTIAFYFFSFLDIGCGIGEYLAVFALCAMALMLLSIITDDWKQLFRSKAVIATLALCIACIITSFRIVHSHFYISLLFDMKKLLIASVLTIIGLTLQLILKKRFKKAIDKKYITQFSLSVFAAILCIVFCSISLTVCANREAAIKEELKEKILACTVYKSNSNKQDTYGYVFDENARSRSFDENGKVSNYDYAADIKFTRFGFGDAYWRSNLIVFDENNQIVGIKHEYEWGDRYVYEYFEFVDSIPTENDSNADTNESTTADTSEAEKKVGDTYIFGSYEQDNNTSNGKEDIEWLVLDKKDGKLLVISKYALDCKQYNTSWTYVTWETCTLRKWLNNEFINSAFTVKEKAMIPTVTVPADKNPSCSTNPGNATQDQVFLLSITEANNYLNSDDAKKCALTDYTIAQGADTSERYTVGGKATCWWWLRSPGETQRDAALVHYGNGVHNIGSDVDYAHGAVRPALWIDLNPQPTLETNDVETQSGSFTLEVTFADGTIKTQAYSYDREIMLGDYLQQEGVITGEKSSYGLYVTTVMDQTLNYDLDQMYWALYVNGEESMNDISSIKIEDGTTYALRAEKAQ